MLDGSTDRPDLIERYETASSTSDLTVDEHRGGPARMVIAAGKALAGKRDADGKLTDRPETIASIGLGHALARLHSEWHGCEKPIHHAPKSIRAWIELLPLIEVGKRTVRGVPVPVMGRDKDGARTRHNEERERLDALYQQELKYLAQKLPSRLAVRQKLYTVALMWGWEDAEEKVAALVKYWVDSNCVACNGTGSVMVGEKPQTCTSCGGHCKSPVPGGYEGYLMHDHMKRAHERWIARLRGQSKILRKGA
jgi:hypothetical protein